jgi:hypothetical protein
MSAAVFDSDYNPQDGKRTPLLTFLCFVLGPDHVNFGALHHFKLIVFTDGIDEGSHPLHTHPLNSLVCLKRTRSHQKGPCYHGKGQPFFTKSGENKGHPISLRRRRRRCYCCPAAACQYFFASTKRTNERTYF